MAKIKFGMMMTDARGKLGGHVFTKTRSGATVRTKVTPVNPRTSAQGQVRARLGLLSQIWNTLTEAQRRAWNDQSDLNKRTNVFGDLYAPTGRSLFISANVNIATAGGTQQLSPQPAVELTPFKIDTVLSEIGDELLDIEFSAQLVLKASETLIVEATPPLSAGRYNFSGQHAIIGRYPSASVGATLSVYDEYIAKYGTAPLSKKVDFRLYIIDKETGQVSPRQSSSVILA